MSACYIKVLTPNGLQDVDYQAESLASAVQYEPKQGVYTVTNTFNTFYTLRFDDHLDRLEDSAKRANIELTLDRSRLKSALRQMITKASFGSVRFRVTVPHDTPQNLILTLEPFTPISTKLKETGVHCITAKDSARHNPVAKTTDWMHARKALQVAMPADAYDTILLDAQDNLLEGLGSNFYAILDSELRTARDGVLLGIAQKIVFDVAPEIISLNHTPVNLADIPNLSEAFITSSSRGIVPVVKIDDIPIGDGQVGMTTKALQSAYNTWVEAHLEPL